MVRPLSARLLVLLALLPFAAAAAQGTPAPTTEAQGSYAQRFDTAWRLVAERYWRLEERPVDWDAVRLEYEPRALAAESDPEFYRLLEAMYEELGDDHSAFVPPRRVEEFRRSYGDLPCLGVFGQTERGEGRRVGGVTVERIGDVGYLRLPDLATPGIAADLRRAVRSLDGLPLDGLVLDLRGNPGGRLVEMMQAAGVFTGGFLWRTLTSWTLPLPYPAVGRTETELPLVVLVDGGVNSAAEGLAGALQVRGRATVVGERTAGNVEAVLPFCLRDGSQAWIATGVLAPIGGPTWEGRGVVPDIQVPAEDALAVALKHLRAAAARSGE